MTYLLQQGTVNGIKNANQCPFSARSSEQLPILRKCKARNSRIMSHNKLSPLRGVMLHPNLALLQSRTNQNQGPGPLGYCAKSLRIRYGLNLVQHFQIRKIVYEYFLFQNDNDSVSPKPNRSYFRTKRKLADASALVVVPDHNLIRRVLRVGSTANECQNIAPKKHLDNADAAAAATIEISAKDLAERIAIIDPEALVDA